MSRTILEQAARNVKAARSEAPVAIDLETGLPFYEPTLDDLADLARWYEEEAERERLHDEEAAWDLFVSARSDRPAGRSIYDESDLPW